VSASPDRAAATRKRSWRGLLLPAAFVFAVLLALGTWQVERKSSKEQLIATLSDRLALPPMPLPPARAWPSLNPATDEYRRVAFTATFDHSKEALVYGAASAFRPDVSGSGYWVFTPARLADGSVVIVNRGFVSEVRKEEASRAAGQIAGPVALVGALRWPDIRHWFSPADDPARNLWFTRDPKAIAAAKGLPDIPAFYVEQESPIPPGGIPQPGKLLVKLSNNHLQYAVTWYGLSLVLLAVFSAYVFKSRRDAAH